MTSKAVSYSKGYEIHMGRTECYADLPPLFYLSKGRSQSNKSEIPQNSKESEDPGNFQSDGIIKGKIAGTYIHGCLDEPEIIDYILNHIFKAGILIKAESSHITHEKAYDRLADHLRTHMNMDAIYRDLTEKG
jgi:adenosylcobyric acid synthase